VGSVVHRGGPDFLYCLSIQHADPSLKVLAAAHAFTLEPGKTNNLKVAVTRLHGLESKMTLTAEGLPSGVRADPVELPGKNGDATLQLVAEADARPFGGPIELVVTEQSSKQKYRVAFALASSGENNGVPQGYKKMVLNSIDQLWLTVLPVKEVTTAVKEK
jgi:hypothetical protein